MSRGYTLIEVLVAMTIFSMALLILIGAFGNFSSRQREAIGQQKLQENLRYTLEQINRELRTGFGTSYQLLATGDTALTFLNQAGECVLYELQGGQLLRWVAAGGSSCDALGIYSGSKTSLTSPDIEVANLRFAPVAAQPNGDVLESQGFVSMQIIARSAQDPSAELKLQSTITSRQFHPAP
jgi:prepilin-type N-terminal cleavage/methylation domain-containing protein